MPKINHNPTTNHRAQTGRFGQINNKQELKNQLILERAIIKSTSCTPGSFSTMPHLNKSALVTGLLATMALSAVVLPCVQAAPTQEKVKVTEPEFAPDPLPPAAVKGGVAINGAPQSQCLVSISMPGSLCTGTLIAPKVVLTAQHCVVDTTSERPERLVRLFDSSQVKVRRVDGDMSNAPSLGSGGHTTEAIYLADGFFVNNQYTYHTSVDNGNSSSFKQDLAVLKLKTSIECAHYYKLPTEAVITESLANCPQRSNSNGARNSKKKGHFTVRGYGGVNAEHPRNLAREARLKCYYWDDYATQNKGGLYMLNNKKNERVALGDSGGPLTWQFNGTEYQVGVSSGLIEAEYKSFYASLRGRIDAINEIVKNGDTKKMVKVGCIKHYSHFSLVWESSQKITLRNTCKQTEQVILAMGTSGKGGMMLGVSENSEHETSSIKLTSGASRVVSIAKKNRPIFPLSKTA